MTAPPQVRTRLRRFRCPIPETPIGAVADLMIETGIRQVRIVGPPRRRVLAILSRQDWLKARKPHRQSGTGRS